VVGYATQLFSLGGMWARVIVVVIVTQCKATPVAKSYANVATAADEEVRMYS
jgi:hypothetical protein